MNTWKESTEETVLSLCELTYLSQVYEKESTEETVLSLWLNEVRASLYQLTINMTG